MFFSGLYGATLVLWSFCCCSKGRHGPRSGYVCVLCFRYTRSREGQTWCLLSSWGMKKCGQDQWEDQPVAYTALLSDTGTSAAEAVCPEGEFEIALQHWLREHRGRYQMKRTNFMRKRWRNRPAAAEGEKHRVMQTVRRWKEATWRTNVPQPSSSGFLLCILTLCMLNLETWPEGCILWSLDFTAAWPGRWRGWSEDFLADFCCHQNTSVDIRME